MTEQEKYEVAMIALAARKQAFREALDYHSESCPECGGEFDGCDFGQWLEIRALGKEHK